MRNLSGRYQDEIHQAPRIRSIAELTLNQELPPSETLGA